MRLTITVNDDLADLIKSYANMKKFTFSRAICDLAERAIDLDDDIYCMQLIEDIERRGGTPIPIEEVWKKLNIE